MVDRLLGIQIVHLTPNRADETFWRDSSAHHQGQSRGGELVCRRKQDRHGVAIESNVADIAHNANDGELLLGLMFRWRKR
jgi:hypothetical protein